MALSLKSRVFGHQSDIPVRYTGDAEDVSPPLQWSHVPAECKSLALLCEDPDAVQADVREDPFVHWIVYNISPNTSSLPEGLPCKGHMDAPVFADQGVNSFGGVGYAGPMPPIGHGVHRYFFKLFALDQELGLKEGATKEQLLHAMKGHILDTAVLLGKYERKRSLWVA